MGLVEFLTARLDEDERVAREATQTLAWRQGTGIDDDLVRITGAITQAPTPADAAHIARWNPVRVLAEIAAKRDVLRHHAPAAAKKHPGFECAWCNMLYPCFDARTLARPYADHPDFESHWAVLPPPA